MNEPVTVRVACPAWVRSLAAVFFVMTGGVVMAMNGPPAIQWGLGAAVGLSAGLFFYHYGGVGGHHSGVTRIRLDAAGGWQIFSQGRWHAVTLDDDSLVTVPLMVLNFSQPERLRPVTVLLWPDPEQNSALRRLRVALKMQGT